MNLCDVNVWLALTLSGHVHHRPCVAWLETVEQAGSVFFCRATHHGLLRLLTNEAVLAPYGNRPLTNEEAWSVADAFLADDRITVRTDEPTGLVPQWGRFARRDTASPKLWMDAYLAAFALTAGWTVVTTDRAFARFEGLDHRVLGTP